MKRPFVLILRLLSIACEVFVKMKVKILIIPGGGSSSIVELELNGNVLGRELESCFSICLFFLGGVWLANSYKIMTFISKTVGPKKKLLLFGKAKSKPKEKIAEAEASKEEPFHQGGDLRQQK